LFMKARGYRSYKPVLVVDADPHRHCTLTQVTNRLCGH
jgi:hypothetical protein